MGLIKKEKKMPIAGHIVFDHDGTMVKTDTIPYLLFDGIYDLLSELNSRGFKLYVWTSRPRRSVQENLKKFGIQHFFSDLFCYDDGLPKPHPMGLEKLTAGIEKEKILHIGDSWTDLEGAKAYGIEVVLACWNGLYQVNNETDQYDSHHDLANYQAFNLAELREIIKGKFYV